MGCVSYGQTTVIWVEHNDNGNDDDDDDLYSPASGRQLIQSKQKILNTN